MPDTTAIRVYRLVASEEARRLVEEYDEEQSFGAPVPEGPPQPSEAELDAIEDAKLLAEALAGLTGDEEDEEAAEAGEVVREIAASSSSPPAATRWRATRWAVARMMPRMPRMGVWKASSRRSSARASSSPRPAS